MIHINVYMYIVYISLCLNILLIYSVFLGVSLVTRKLGNQVSPVVELTKNGDTYTLSSTSTFKNSIITFKLGEEFDEETPDGRKVITSS